MTIDLATLNEAQLAAAKWQDGPLLVLAGPGSGKTRVLTLRVARLIEETPEARFRVLAVTFTNKAASEMRSRIDAILSTGRERANLTTFHSFAADILRQHGSHVGLRPDFAILSEQADREAVLSDAIKAVSLENSDFRPRPSQLLPAINRMLDECVSPDEAGQWLKNHPNAMDVAAIYASYRQRLINSNQMDFGSLLSIAVDLLEKKPAIAKQVRRVYSYVCVDEFQDTNYAQYRLLLQLTPETRPNLFVVADDDQVIYQWNGASPARLADLRSRFGMDVIQLPENFRCPPEVIELANNLIAHNSDRSPGKMALTARKARAGADPVVAKGFATFDDEIAWLAERLSRLSTGDRKHCAIMARRRKLLEYVVDGLVERSVPAFIAIRKNEFESAPFRWLHAMLRLANARHDREQLARVCRAFYQLEGIRIEVDDVAALAAVGSNDFLRAWLEAVSQREGIEESTQRVLSETRSTLLERLDFRSFIALAQNWFSALEDSKTDQIASALEGYHDEALIWRTLTDEIETQYSGTEMSLHNYLQELDLRAKEKPVPADAVRCFTIHASKGLEFRNVFLIGLVEDELPSWAAKKKGNDSDEMREERRNCFVAITRTEETLTLTYAGKYFGYPKAPSRFLSEMKVPGVKRPGDNAG